MTDTLLRALRYVSRRLLKNPGSSAMAVVAFALGIGLTATMYAVIDGALLRGLPFVEPHRLIHLERNNLSRGITSMVSQHDFEDWRSQQQSFEELAGFALGTLNLSGEYLPQRYKGVWVSANFLELLRVDPVLGRRFEPADEAPGAPHVILLGYHVWQERYGGDPSVVGRNVRANSEPTTIVGVLPEDFRFPIYQDVWMPLILESGALQRGEGRTLEVFGRLKEGVGLERAASEMATIARRLEQQYPATNSGVGVVLEPYAEAFIDEQSRLLLGVMFSAVVLVLLIACFNVANLLIGRAATRGHELTIRVTLGAGRGRILAQVLSESTLLALTGAAIGIVLAHFSARALADAIIQNTPLFWLDFRIDGRVLLFTLGITVLAALIAGLAPALRASSPNLTQMLNDAGRGTTSLRLGWVSRVLVVLEVAMSCALLVVAGLMVRSVLTAYDYDLHFQPANVLTARVGLPEVDYPEEKDRLAFFDDLLTRLTGQAAVVAAAVGTVIPADTELVARFTLYQRPGESYNEPRNMPFARLTVVSPGYFESLGVRPLAGRYFAAADRAGMPAVALVNEDFAGKEWPGQSPIGQRIDLWLGSEAETENPEAGWVEVVGMVPDLRFAEFDNIDDQQAIYLPLAQHPRRFVSIIVKTRGDPVAFAEPLRRIVQELDSNLPIYFVRSMDRVLARTMFYPNLFGLLFGTFGGLAVILACLGLYGVMAFGVSQRTREMGVRVALGARSRDVIALVLKQGLRQVSVGLVIGLMLAAALASSLGAFLFLVRTADPLTFASVPALLLLLAIIACLVPACRASAVNPVEALRYQ